MTSRHFLTAAALAVLLSLGVLVAAAAPAAPSSTSTSASAFYAGKQLTLIVPASLGSMADHFARQAAPVMAAFLRAHVAVVDSSGSGSLNGQAQLATAAPDGRTFGELNLPYDFALLISGHAPLPFRLGEFDPVGFVGPPADLVWCVAPSFRDRTFLAVVDDRTPVLVPSTDNDLDDLVVRSVNGIFGVRAKMLSGYPSSYYVLYGFERGDGPLAAAPITQFLPLIESGRARPILLLDPPPGTASLPALRSVPTLARFAQLHPPKTSARRRGLGELSAVMALSGESLALPRGVPASRVALLATAFTRAMGKVEPGEVPVVGAPAEAAYSAAVTNAGALAPYLR